MTTFLLTYAVILHTLCHSVAACDVRTEDFVAVFFQPHYGIAIPLPFIVFFMFLYIVLKWLIVNGKLLFLMWFNFTALLQRIFNCSEIQHTSGTLNKASNVLTYGLHRCDKNYYAGEQAK